MENELTIEQKEEFLKAKGWYIERTVQCISPSGLTSCFDINSSYEYALRVESELTSLPEKWCILRTPESAEVIERWFNKGNKEVFCTNNYSWLYYDEKKRTKLINHASGTTSRHSEFTPITFEQFKKWVLKEGHNQIYTNESERPCFGQVKVPKADFLSGREPIKPIVEFVEDERKVIGWNFKDEYEKFKETARVIINTRNNFDSDKGFDDYGGVDKEKGILFERNSGAERDLTSAGVLNVWCEPVFDEVKEVDEDLKKRLLDEFNSVWNNYSGHKDRDWLYSDFLIGKIAELQLKIENK